MSFLTQKADLEEKNKTCLLSRMKNLMEPRYATAIMQSKIQLDSDHLGWRSSPSFGKQKKSRKKAYIPLL